MMKNDPFLRTLGLAKRAGKLCYGYDSVLAQKTMLWMVFCAKDLSERSGKNVAIELSELHISPVILEYDMADLGYAIGTKPVGIIGITDEGFERLLTGKLNMEVTQ